MLWVAITAAWMLWQEILLPNSLGQPSWHLDSEFSGERACNEARKIRILDQIMRQAMMERPSLISPPSRRGPCGEKGQMVTAPEFVSSASPSN